jgi:SAM-dependent methyltransferase
MGEAIDAAEAERARYEAEIAVAHQRYDALRSRRSVRAALAVADVLNAASGPLRRSRLEHAAPAMLKAGFIPLRHRRIGSFAAWRSYGVRSAAELRRTAQAEATLSTAPAPVAHEGWCHVCRHRSTFTRSTSNLREDLPCVGCNLNNRLRASVWLFEQECRPGPQTRVYLTEQVTALHAVLAARYPLLRGSEYLGPTVARGAVVNGVRNESLTDLTFEDGAFDAILSFEVFEHIPDYRRALTECARVLAPGGHMVFSVPFLSDAAETLVRARVGTDGTIEHLLPAEYHGDPLSSDGCLCFQHFGWDLLDDLRAAGFSRAWACAYWSPRFGYLGGTQLQFVAVR